MGIAERKERERKQRREEIVDAAEQVFFSKGFEQSTMDDVAEAAELSKGTLYLYFVSKGELHMAVARRAIHLLRSWTNEAIAKGGSVLDKLSNMGLACVEFSKKHPDQMKSIMALEEVESGEIKMSPGDLQQMIYQESTVGTVIEMVEQGVAENLIRSDLPAALIAHTLWMSVLSVIRFATRMEELFESLGFTAENVYKSQFELVLNGIRK